MIAENVSYATESGTELQTEFRSIEQVELADGRRLAYLTFLNESDETIVGIIGHLTMLDENKRIVGRRRISFHNLGAKPREVYVLNLQLDDYPAFSAGHLTVESISFQMPDEEPMLPAFVELEERHVVTEEEKAALSRIAEDAVCFPEQHDSHWTCACGRHTPNEWNLCFGCNRIKYRVFREFNKETVLANYRALRQAEQERAEREKIPPYARRRNPALSSVYASEEKYEKFERILVFTIVIVLVGMLLLWGFAQSQKSPNQPGDLTTTTFHHTPAVDYLDPV